MTDGRDAHGGRLRALGLVLALWSPVSVVSAQSPNTGGLSFTASVDVPTAFVFRGIVQERDPEVTLTPAADVAVALGAGWRAHVGTWHSLHTGDAGLDGPTGRLHYREDVYVSLDMPIGRGFQVTSTYGVFTSPNLLFNTVHDLSLKVASTSRVAPYGLVAFELSGAADDIDRGTGSYAELGVAPSFGLGARASVRVPVRIGVSLNRYYQDFAANPTFGFVTVGGLLTYPLGRPGRFGTWQVRGGADIYRFGETTERFNADRTGDPRAVRVVGSVGLRVAY